MKWFFFLLPWLLSGHAQNGMCACSTPLLIDLALQPAPTTLIGANTADRLGQDLAVGDFDGNGQLDIAVLGSGTVSVGDRPPFVVLLFNVSSVNGVVDLSSYGGPMTTITAIPGDAGTRSHIVEGDFNGDQHDDIALSVPNIVQGAHDGKVYIVYGSPVLPGEQVMLQAAQVPTTTLLAPIGSGSVLGSSLSSGDMNGDGIDELIVAAPYQQPGGIVYVLHGGALFPGTVNLDTLSTGVTRIVESDWYMACGVGLACGDVDSDAHDDLLIGAPGDLTGVPGTAFLIFGEHSLPAVVPVSDSSSTVTRFFGEHEDDLFGWSVGIADLNGDGLKEPIVAAPTADPLGCNDCGEVYAFMWDAFTPDAVYASDVSKVRTYYVGSWFDRQYGANMATGPFNVDLAEELVLASGLGPFIPSGRPSVVVPYGTYEAADSVFVDEDSTLTTVLPEQADDYLGSGLMIADLNGDGVGDLVMGAKWASALGRAYAGKVYVIYGCATVTAAGNGPVSPRASLFIHPNPANPTAVVTFDLSGREAVQIELFDVRGAVVCHLAAGDYGTGTHRVVWDGRDDRGRPVASGTYFCRLTAGSFVETRKITILK